MKRDSLGKIVEKEREGLSEADEFILSRIGSEEVFLSKAPLFRCGTVKVGSQIFMESKCQSFRTRCPVTKLSQKL